LHEPRRRLERGQFGLPSEPGNLAVRDAESDALRIAIAAVAMVQVAPKRIEAQAHVSR
jgi:hypothetical protein